VDLERKGERQLYPLKWLGSFSMPNFTDAGILDDTLWRMA